MVKHSLNEPKNEITYEILDKSQKSTYQTRLLSPKTKFLKEKLIIYSKKTNFSQYSSFQFDCIYNGPKYLTVELVWFKENSRLDFNKKIEKHSQLQRIFNLDYKT